MSKKRGAFVSDLLPCWDKAVLVIGLMLGDPLSASLGSWRARDIGRVGRFSTGQKCSNPASPP